MIKLMFVCHGNICRSPMAEFVMKKLAADAGVQDEFYIESCATSTEEIWNGVGNHIYPPAQLKRSDYDKYDYLIAMDSNNVRNIMRIIGTDAEGKAHLLMDFTGRGGSVADPWYTGGFDTAYSDIEDGCKALLEELA